MAVDTIHTGQWLEGQMHGQVICMCVYIYIYIYIYIHIYSRNDMCLIVLCICKHVMYMYVCMIYSMYKWYEGELHGQ